MTNNSLYIVKCNDNLTENPMPLEYEFSNLEHAYQLYRDFLNDSNIIDLYLYEYDFTTKQYHLVQY